MVFLGCTQQARLLSNVLGLMYTKETIHQRAIYITSISDERAVWLCWRTCHAKCILSLISLYSLSIISNDRLLLLLFSLFFVAAAGLGPSRMSIEDGKENRRNLYTQWQQQHTMSYMLLGPSTSKTFRYIMAFSIFILFLLYVLYVSLFHVYRERQQRERWRMESKRSFDIWLH